LAQTDATMPKRGTLDLRHTLPVEDDDGVARQCHPEGLFATPMSLSVSGGTAAFFEVKYAGPPSGPQAERYGKTPTYWIGKDLARAKDEIDFYEGIHRLDPSFTLIHNWAMDYGGILTTTCEVGGELEAEPRQLLLLENLRDGKAKLRMLDIKLGNVTAVAGWKGKSLVASVRNRFVDMVTTSSKRGNRLEGFDNPPIALKSRMDGPSQACFGIDRSKKYKRLLLQRLSTVEALHNFADMSDVGDIAGSHTLLSIEYSEALLYDLCLQLSELCLDASRMPVPQMWIGSSLGVCCDSGQLPSRRTLESLRAGKGAAGLALVRIFDWGRSELETMLSYLQLSDEEKEQRNLYWCQWQSALVRIWVSSMTAYYRQFLWNADEARPFQGVVRFELWDADTLDEHDYIGNASIPLADTHGRIMVPIVTENLHDLNLFHLLTRAAAEGVTFCSGDGAVLEVEVEEARAPADSRLERVWYVTVHNVFGVPSRDLFSASDPLVMVQVNSDTLLKGPIGCTQTEWDVQDAALGARLEFGALKQQYESDIFNRMSRVWGGKVTPDMLRLVTQAMLHMEDPATALDRQEGPDDEYEHSEVLDMFLDMTSWQGLRGV